MVLAARGIMWSNFIIGVTGGREWIFEELMINIFLSKFGGNPIQDLRSSVKLKEYNITNKIMPRHNIKKMLEVNDKIPQKEQKEKKKTFHREEPNIRTVDTFMSETSQTKSQLRNLFLVLKK